MVLTTAEKSKLTTSLATITNSFNSHSGDRAFMALYFTPFVTPYITFSNSNTFPSTVTIGRSKITLGVVYITAQNFTTQTNAFLSA